MAKQAATTEAMSRAHVLAREAFFRRRMICGAVVYAEMPAGAGHVHRVSVSLEDGTFYCSCPFRTRPCVHALALQKMYTEKGEAAFEATDNPPDWEQAAQGGLSVAVPDPSADDSKAKRRSGRLGRAAAGLEDLEIWLTDLLRRGLATTASEEPKWWEHIATRMADASMPGLARKLRLLGEVPASDPRWAERIAGSLAECYLAVRAFQQSGHLPEPMLRDLEAFIGIAAKKEEVLAEGERLRDTWTVAGQVSEALEAPLKERRSWLHGADTGRWALLLDHVFGSEDFPPGFEPGSVYKGTFAFYPSAFPLRVLAAGELEALSTLPQSWSGFPDIAAFADAYAAALAAQPWLAGFPAWLCDVVPYRNGERFFVADANEKSLPLNAEPDTGWSLVSLAGGRPLDLFGEWDGALFSPLSAFSEGRLVRLRY